MAVQIKGPMAVQTKCRNCGNMAPSNQFKLDYRYGFVVCPICQKGKDHQKESQKLLREVKTEDLPQTGPRRAKPVGWDSEDEMLERMWAEKQQKKGTIVRLGKNIMRFTCNKCGYTITFSESRKPKGCPYCDTPLPEY